MPQDERAPIAIVGIGCRMPGGQNEPWQLHEALLGGLDAMLPVPTERWETASFNCEGRRMGLLGGIDQFDPTFFGISAIEAERVDPQQRLLLETSVHALEDAGIKVSAVRGTRTGVYVGVSNHDWATVQVNNRTIDTINGFCATGSAMSIAANRVSFFLGAEGPSMSVDTACSSSLLAVHLAVQALRHGECEAALAGGANVILSPLLSVAFTRGGFLSPDGRCKAFDDSADGFARSEGAAMFVLKPLPSALRDGDRVYACILGSATNEGSDGGMSRPCQRAQRDVIASALADARLEPRLVQYVEAHGTGTRAGDPVEAAALGEAIGRQRPRGSPLLVGSVKTNVGHLEPASGAAGLAKLALAMRTRAVPGDLHLRSPSALIDFEGLNIAVAARSAAWPGARDGEQIYAGINSFGFGGSNVHLVLSGPPLEAPLGTAQPADRDANNNRAVTAAAVANDNNATAGATYRVLPLSARSETSLAALAESYARLLSSPGAPPLDSVCSAASALRDGLNVRAAVVCTSASDAAEALGELGRSIRAGAKLSDPRVLRGRRPDERSVKTAFVFSGQGPQWVGMANELQATEPVFARVVDEIDALVAELDPAVSVKRELALPPGQSRMDADPALSQLMLLTVQIALARLWISRGVVPDGYMGHSSGEVAATHLAGAISLRDACAVVYHRSRLQKRAQGKGKMLAVGLGERDARRLLEEHPAGLEIAALNGPSATTLTGEEEVLRAIADELAAKKVFARFVRVVIPFHSRHMDPIRDELTEALAGIHPHKATDGDLYSTETGKLADGAAMGPGHWFTHIRHPVLFERAVRAMVADGYNTFVEVSPHRAVGTYVVDTCRAAGVESLVVGSLRRGDGVCQSAELAHSQALLYAWGFDSRAKATPEERNLRLPLYPWDYRTCWAETYEREAERRQLHWHPHLRRLCRSLRDRSSATMDIEYQVSSEHRFLQDHVVNGQTVVPIASMLEVSASFGREMYPEAGGELFLEDVLITHPLFLPAQARIEINSDRGCFYIYSRPEPPKARHEPQPRRRSLHHTWKLSCSGRVNVLQDEFVPRRAEQTLEALRQGLTLKLMAARGLYDWIAEFSKINFGPCFRCMREFYAGLTDDGLPTAIGRVQLPDSLAHSAMHQRFLIHPCLLDAAFVAAWNTSVSRTGVHLEHYGTFLPRRVDRFRVLPEAAGASELWVHIVITKQTHDGKVTDFRFFTPDGRVVAEMQGYEDVIVPGSADSFLLDNLGGYYRWSWSPLEPSAPSTCPQQPTLLLCDSEDSLVRDIAGASAPCSVAEATEQVSAETVRGAGAVVLNFSRPESGRDVVEDTRRNTDRLLELAHAVLECPRDCCPRLLVVVTRGAQHAGPGDAPPSECLAQSALWGMARSVVLELEPLTGCRVALVDVAAEASDADARAAAAHTHDGKVTDFRFFTPDGRVVAEMQGYEDVIVPGSADSFLLDNLGGYYRWSWSPLEPSAPSTCPQQPTLLLCDSEDSLVRDIAGASAPCSVAAATEQVSAETVRGAGAVVLYFSRPESGRDVVEQTRRNTDRLLELAHAVLECPRDCCPRLLVVVTRGAQHASPGDAPPSECLAQSALWGMARSVVLELEPLTGCRVALVDVAAEASDADARAAAAHVRALLCDPEGAARAAPEVAVRGGSLLLHELARDPPPEQRALLGRTRMPACGGRYHVSMPPSSGSVLANLRLEASQRPRSLPPGAVEIAVRAASLNFRDVLCAAGMLPADAIAASSGGTALGGECAGVVTAVGEGVSRWRVGDEVIACPRHALAGSAIAREPLVWAKPAFASFEYATALPVVYVTAQLALVELCALRAGEWVLVHSAAGGVGVAAINIARAVGARVIATASRGKHAYLRSLGVEHVLDSSSPAFRNDVMRLTGGRGVDVVLNSLAGRMIAQSLRCLAQYGRFAEIGKADVYRDSKLSMRTLAGNCSFHTVDVDSMMRERPERVAALLDDALRTLAGLEAQGRLVRHELRVLPMSRAAEAFAELAKGKVLGKVVLSTALGPPEVTVDPSDAPAQLDERASYAVTGGTSGLGLFVAKWLLARGAGEVVLVSRSGAVRPGAAEMERNVMAELLASGRVRVVRADVSVASEARAAVAACAANGLELRGVFHAAAVFDDRVLRATDSQSMWASLAPKAAGAWRLHEATLGLALDHFVLVSSVASVLGNPGQANYSASNAFLDELARHRARLGLPAAVVNLGPLQSHGYLARTRSARILDLLSARGWAPLRTWQVESVFERVLREPRAGDPQLVAAVIDWKLLADAVDHVARDARVGRLLRECRDGGDPAGTEQRVSVRERVTAAATDEEACAAIAEYLRGCVGRITGTRDTELVDTEVSLTRLGLDSLMTNQLQSSVLKDLAVEIPLMRLVRGPTIAQLAHELTDELRRKPGLQEAGGDDQLGQPGEVSPASAKPSEEKKGAIWDIECVSDESGEYPVSSAQEDMWNLSAQYRTDPRSTALILTSIVEMDFAVDTELLVERLALIPAHHRVFRTAYRRNVAGQLVQFVSVPKSESRSLISVVDMGGVEAGRYVEAMSEELRGTFDLERGPVLRIAVGRLGGNRHLLGFAAHHIAVDAVSTAVLLRMASHVVTGRIPEPLRIQYSDYALWQRAQLAKNKAQLLETWVPQLRGCEPFLNIPVDHPYPAARMSNRGAVEARLPAELCAQIEPAAAARGATAFSLMLACMAEMMRRVAGQSDVVLGYMVANRVEEVRDLVGFFVNVLPLRTHFDANGPQTLGDLVEHVLLKTREGQNVSGLPLSVLVDELGVQRSSSRPPLVQAAFNLVEPLSVDVDGLRAHIDAREDSQYDLVLRVTKRRDSTAPESPPSFDVMLQYYADVIERGSAQRMLDCYLRLLRDFVALPAQTPLRDLRMLSEAEQITDKSGRE
eukprot:m51a1_g7706 putative polyketide synthase (2901) ;mRNA; r:86795-96982